MGDIKTIILSVISIMLTALVTWGIERLISYLNTKIKNEKINLYLDEIGETIIRSVNKTNQIFVDELKKEGKFDKENQKIALENTLIDVKNTLSYQTKKFIEENYADMDTLIKTHIENCISNKKNW